MNSNNSVWILDDDRSIRWVLEKSLGKTGLHTESFENGDDLSAQTRAGIARRDHQ